mgnify:FL=1
MENEEQSPLEKIKKEYEIFKQKYNLPDFDKINEDFQIEKAAEPETEILLKEIRRYMFDKISNYMRFMESLLSPVNASIFTFSILKSLNSEDKKNIEEVYKKLMKLELDLMEIDVDYNEEKEAEFIKNTFKVWNSIKKDWLRVIDSIKNNWDNKIDKGNNKGYFG